MADVAVGRDQIEFSVEFAYISQQTELGCLELLLFFVAMTFIL